MQSNIITAAAKLSDGELLRRLEALAGRERHATVELVAHLAELDSRKLYLAQGYGSLFSFCTEALKLSEHATYNRIEAARASRAFPMILDRLAKGAITLSTVRLLAPHLRPDNHERLLAEASGRSKREVEALVARLSPQADVPAYVRRLLAVARATGPSAIVPASEPAMAVHPPSGLDNLPGAIPEPAVMPAALAAIITPAVHRPAIAPLTSERYRIQFTISRETEEKLRRVRDLLRREIPNGDPGTIFDRALTLLLEHVARKKLAATEKPRPSRGTDPHSRHIPAEVKRQVWMRDGGQCAFVAKGGRRCRERAFLEFHHVDAYGIGGESTTSNLSLRCRAHNVYESELVFERFPPLAREAPDQYSPWSGLPGGKL